MLAAAAVALLAAAGIVLWLGQEVAALLDAEGGDYRRLAVVILLGVMLAPISALRFYYSNRFALEVSANLRRAAFAEALQSGGVGEQIIADAEAVRSILAEEALPSVRNFVLFLGATGLMFATSLYLAMVTMLLTLPILAAVALGIRAMRATARNWRAVQTGLHSRLHERVRLRRVVRAFRREAREVEEFGSLTLKANRAFFAYLRRRALLSALVIAATVMAVGVVFWQGAGVLAEGDLSRGQLAAFLFYGVLAAVSLSGFTDSATAWGRLEAALSALYAPPRRLYLRSSDPLEFESLEFQHVSFTYPGEKRKALDRVSFTLKNGNAHALVGQSGSGKSTIFYLILGFLRADRGRILINRRPLESLEASRVRQIFGLVPQDSALLTGSILSNIAYGSEEKPSSRRIRECLKAVGAEFVYELPGGLNREISANSGLSEGQKQRLAWARALLGGAQVLLLDEATSALDAIHEEALIKNLKRTCLVIAHRPAAMRAADKVTLLAEGRVIAEGSHAALTKSSPLYRHLSSKIPRAKF